jgi:N-ethylmaleimide reductase
VENRIRFAVEVARRTAKRIGGDRLGMRVSPYGELHGMKPDETVEEVYESLAREMSAIGLVYLHVVDLSSMGGPEVKPSVKRRLREAFRGTLILSGGYDRDRAEADLAEKKGDLVAFGRPFIGNPRLVTRLRERQALAPPDPTTFYTPGEKGYIDYPVDG